MLRDIRGITLFLGALALVLACMSGGQDLDGDGYDLDVDCVPYDATIHPGAPDVCDRVDNDCDNQVDEEWTVDADGDGFGDEGTPWDCVADVDHSALATDCDDTDAAIGPHALEVPYTRIDEDCSEATPDDDVDGDGYLLADDCDDEDALVNPETLVTIDGDAAWPDDDLAVGPGERHPDDPLGVGDRVDLVGDLPPRAAPAVPARIPGLEDEVRDDAVEQEPVVVALLGEGREVPHRSAAPAPPSTGG